MQIHNFKELLVWQKSIEIVEFIYTLTVTFPVEEKFGLRSQMQRCAVSIPSNIAEGSGRVSPKEFQHFLSISLGSSYELETQMILAAKFNYIKKQQLDEFNIMILPIQKMLFGLYKSLNK
jgi:four helix bundle protein